MRPLYVIMANYPRIYEILLHLFLTPLPLTPYVFEKRLYRGLTQYIRNVDCSGYSSEAPAVKSATQTRSWNTVEANYLLMDAGMVYKRK